MLMRHRRAEDGQALLMAIGFLAFLGIIAAVVVNLWSATEAQRGSTERTAARDSVAEGSAQFALADTGSQGCGTVSGGTMHFAATTNGPADTLTYTVPAGTTGCGSSSSSSNANGFPCALCLLNSPSSPTSTQVLSSGKQSLVVSGEIDSNGSISGPVAATKIGLAPGATCSSCSPTTALSTRFTDPLAGTMPLPSAPGAAVANCCSGVIHPGAYKAPMSIQNNTVWMTTGLYVFTSNLDISGNSGVLTNTDASGSSVSDSDSGSKDSDAGGVSDSDATKGTGSGNPVTYGSNTLTDVSKVWTINQWVNATVAVTHQNGTVTGIVASNTATRLTLTANWSGTVTNKDAYVVSPISYTQNTLKDVAKNWAANQWAGSVVIATLSDGSTVSAIVQGNSPNTLALQTNWSTMPSIANAFVVSTKIGYGAKTLVDVTKSWTANQWAGAIVSVTLTSGSTVTGTVASNTSNAITLTANWSTIPSAGNAYIVSTISYTATTLRDSSKSWTTNQWQGATVTVSLSIGGGSEPRTVLSNTSNTLSVSAWSPVPSPGDSFAVGTITYGSTTLTDSSKSWATDQWKGAVVTVTLSAGTTENETVLSNTANTITVASWSPVQPGTGNTYVLVAPVVIYLACPSAPPYWSCAVGGQQGGGISTSGQGTLNLLDYPTGQYNGIQPQWEHFAVITDPNLTAADTGGPVVSASGNGVKTFGGGIYAPRGVVDVAGNGNATIGGRIVVQSLAMNGNGLLSLTGTGAPPSTVACFYYNDDVTGVEAGSGGGVPRDGLPHKAHVRFETGCNSAGLQGLGTSPTSIIDFTYDDGP